MKRYITERKEFVKLLIVALAASLPMIHSCKDDYFATANGGHNVTLAFSRAGETAVEQIPTIRLFTFYSDEEAPNDKMFHQEVLNLSRDLAGDKVSAQVETGRWNMALLSTPNGGSILPPVAGTVMSELPMYKYQPAIVAGRSTDAHEIYLDNRVTPTITSGGPHTMSAQLNRTVAKVELIIEKTTQNFNLNGTHSLKLHHIPSTLSYTGALLPDKANPDTLSAALVAPVTLQNDGAGSCKGTETITFIIPAHRGTDYVNYTGTMPTDTTTLKMAVTLDLERTGGSRFVKQAEIPIVAKANMTLRVYIGVNDGIEFATEVLDWYGVPLELSVGAGYQNWLYVKKDATGNGLSWSDALPDISTAIEKARALDSTGRMVYGILVAGGPDFVYNEGFTVSAGIEVYGGWEGIPGTELAAEDPNAVYTSPDRRLKDHKAIVTLGTNVVSVDGGRSILDGFILRDADASNTDVVYVANGGWINAVEIRANAITQGSVLKLSEGTASNVLVARNGRGISASDGSMLINATVVENKTKSFFENSTAYNSIFWPETIEQSAQNTFRCCLFTGMYELVPDWTNNFNLNKANDGWFGVRDLNGPGPQFKLTAESGEYRALGNRAPMLGRGNEALYAPYVRQWPPVDIDGTPRYYADPKDPSKNWMDIGCYQEPEDGLRGFHLEWAADCFYLLPKGGYLNKVPLVLSGNDNPETYIDVSWDVNTLSESPWSDWEGGYYLENEENAGYLVFKNAGTTPTDDYTGSEKRKWGQLLLSTFYVGNYIPDKIVDVYQLPGVNAPWDDGYAGSFHRNNEVGARYIHAHNIGDWEVRILSGFEWIKIDDLDMNAGTDITDPDEGKTPHNTYYKDVQGAQGGVVRGTGNIKFRVGMKSKNPEETPRYGLILITRDNGNATFFVRQGEAEDYLYRSDIPRMVGGADLGRTQLVKFSPYNLTDPEGRVSGNMHSSTTGFTKYPSQIGYYFRWNKKTAFSFNCGEPTTGGGNPSTWTASADICPTGYRHPSQYEFIHTIYEKVGDSEGTVSPSFDDIKYNFVWGAYADGYYDQLAGDALAVTPTDMYAGKYNVLRGSGAKIAGKGVLMVNSFDHGSIFFPAGGVMGPNGMTATTSPENVFRTVEYAMLWAAGTSEYGKGTNPKRNTHWGWRYGADLDTPRIGMNGTTIESTETNVGPEGLGNIRCVKKP